MRDEIGGDLLAGKEDPRPGTLRLLRRALARLPVRGASADCIYAHDEQIGFAIGARAGSTLWRLLYGIAEQDWGEAVDMGNAPGLRVSTSCPN